MAWDTEILNARGLISSGFYLPYNPKLVSVAREMRKNMTEAEKKIWFGLLRRFRFRVFRQRPIDNFIVDFYCPKLKLVFEIDGQRHYSIPGHSHDIERTAILNGYGLKVIRFSNNEIVNHFDEVKQKITDMCS